MVLNGSKCTFHLFYIFMLNRRHPLILLDISGFFILLNIGWVVLGGVYILQRTFFKNKLKKQNLKFISNS